MIHINTFKNSFFLYHYFLYFLPLYIFIIALIELVPLEDNMNPLLFSDQRVYQLLNAGHGSNVFEETL